MRVGTQLALQRRRVSEPNVITSCPSYMFLRRCTAAAPPPREAPPPFLTHSLAWPSTQRCTADSGTKEQEFLTLVPPVLALLDRVRRDTVPKCAAGVCAVLRRPPQ
jgi:hypothetical protein